MADVKEPESAMEPEHPSKPDSLADTEVIDDGGDAREKKPLSKRILGIIWDSLDKTPEERRFMRKVDLWIMTYICVAYFVKYLDQTNVCRILGKQHVSF